MELRQLIARSVASAREQAGLNQSEAAKQLGIDRPRLIGMEKGERPIDATMLVQLAQLYRVAVGELLQPRERSTPVEIRFRGVDQGELTGPETIAIREFQQFCIWYAALLDRSGRALPKPRLLGLEPGTSRTRRYAVEADADELRRSWDLSSVAPIGSELFDHLEDNGVSVYRRDVEGSQLAGASVNFGELGPVMLVNTCDTPQRQVFTAAHELAHLIYHLPSDAGGLFISRKLDTTADEQLANDFASAFLMPAAGIKLFLAKRGPRDEQVDFADVIALQRHFKVSYAAMLVRLRKLGIIKGGGHFDELRAVRPVREAQRLGYPIQRWEWAYNSELRRPAGLPDQYVSLVLAEHGAGTLTAPLAAEYLETSLSDFGEYVRRLESRVSHPSLEDEFQDAEVSVG